MATLNEAKKIRKFKGAIISASGNKTVIIKVDRAKKNLKYNKQYTVSKRYAAHDEKNQFKVGDVVSFVECRPISRTKRWRVVNK